MRAAAEDPVVLVPHSNAGLFVPAAVEVLGDRVRGAMFVDAALPGAGHHISSEFLRGLATVDGLLPPWTSWWDEADVAALFPDGDVRARVEAEQPRMPLAYYDHLPPAPPGWAVPACGYIWFGAPYDKGADQAVGNGWPTGHLPGGHLHMLVDPDARPWQDGLVTLTLPPTRIPDPLDAPAIRWGVLAPGGIARDWTAALHETTASRVTAVGSRSLDRAQAFAADFGVERAHGTYEDLVADDGVDAIYVASPHSEHHDHALLALEAGKPVLVEKAFTRNAAEAAAVIDAARTRGLLLVEAMWTRFLPHVDVVRRCLEDGLLGEVKAVEADHGQQLYPDGPQRMADPALAGGALLDLAIYPIAFAHLALGGFTTVQATGTLAETGVDAGETIAVIGPQGAVGTLASTMVAKTPCAASISGTAARLEIDGWFYQPNTVHLIDPDDHELDRYDSPRREHGLAYEAAEFARLLSDGRTESDLLPLDETHRLMQVLDEVRGQLGVTFPGEG